MKTLLSALALTLAAPAAFAGTAVSYTNDALGFRLIQSMQGTEICDSSSCISIEEVKKIDKSTTLYREESGKCEIEIEQFDMSFARGNTRDEFMLSLGGQVVRVVKGDANCQLRQDSMNQKRSVTGIYL